MKLAIMQPYIFPYIGYFQLIYAADRFIVYDDVTFIKQGWINRNRILNNTSPLLFSIPLSGAGSNVLIRDVRINHKEYLIWRTKYFKTLEQCYRKAPQYKNILPLIQGVFSGSPELVSHLAVHSLKSVCDILNITTEFVETSVKYTNNHLRSQNRVIDICRKESANMYINPFGGTELYSREYFRTNGIELAFIKSRDIIYNQFTNQFVPWLSIIDVLMFNPIENVRQFLTCYELV